MECLRLLVSICIRNECVCGELEEMFNEDTLAQTIEDADAASDLPDSLKERVGLCDGQALCLLEGLATADSPSAEPQRCPRRARRAAASTTRRAYERGPVSESPAMATAPDGTAFIRTIRSGALGTLRELFLNNNLLGDWNSLSCGLWHRASLGLGHWSSVSGCRVDNVEFFFVP